MINSQLLALFLKNKGVGHFKAEVENDSATIYIYDMIVSDEFSAMFGGVAPESFAKTLNSISAPVIHLRINSPGGDVFGARAMETAIAQHPSKIIAHIDGIAASAASFLAMAADEVRISSGATLMIHNAWGMSVGDKTEMRATADLLEMIDDAIANTYAARTKRDVALIKDWMNSEKWFNAASALENGFADVIDETVKNAIRWDLNAFKNCPKNEPEHVPHNIKEQHLNQFTTVTTVTVVKEDESQHEQEARQRRMLWLQKTA